MSRLLLSDPGTRWTQATEPWASHPSYYFLHHEILVERSNFNFGISWWIMRSRNISRKFFNQSLRSVSNCWTWVCWAVVLSTRPRSLCWINNFRTSWWVMRSRNLTELWGRGRKYYKSKSLNLTLNCEVKNILAENIISPNPWTWPWIVRSRISLNRQVSLVSISIGLEPPIISSRV